MAATDLGHSGMGADWGLDDQQRQDFAHRAQHLTARAAKALIQAYCGLTPAEVAVMAGFHHGPRDGAGLALTPGQSVHGAVQNWQGVSVPDRADPPPMSAMTAEPVLNDLALSPARPWMSLDELDFSTDRLQASRPSPPDRGHQPRPFGL